MQRVLYRCRIHVYYDIVSNIGTRAIILRITIFLKEK